MYRKRAQNSRAFHFLRQLLLKRRRSIRWIMKSVLNKKSFVLKKKKSATDTCTENVPLRLLSYLALLFFRLCCMNLLQADWLTGWLPQAIIEFLTSSSTKLLSYFNAHFPCVSVKRIFETHKLTRKTRLAPSSGNKLLQTYRLARLRTFQTYCWRWWGYRQDVKIIPVRLSLNDKPWRQQKEEWRNRSNFWTSTFVLCYCHWPQWSSAARAAALRPNTNLRGSAYKRKIEKKKKRSIVA